MVTRWVDIKTKAIARIVLARTARPKKLELSSCWHDLHQAWLSESSFPVPRWADKQLAFVSVALCEVERISESGSVSTQPNDFDFCQQLHATVSVWVAVSVWLISPSRWDWLCRCRYWQQSYLVDPASSHMPVSKIKPCMSKYKQLYTVKLRTAHYISNNLFDGFLLHG